jgi:hypothetical protein
MGSDGATAAQFPSIIKPRGLLFDGGDRVNMGDDDRYTFADDVSDKPFSLACIFFPTDLTNYRIIIQKGTAVNAGEYVLYMTDVRLIRFLLTDNSTGGYFYRTCSAVNAFRRIPGVLAAVYSGSGVVGGLSFYWNGVRIDSSGVTSGVYTRMRNTANALTVGTSSGGSNGMIGNLVLPVIDDKEWSPLQVKAITARLLRLARTP